MALQFKLAQMSLTMQEGTVARWLKAEGDMLKKNEAMIEVETDKVTAEVTAPCDGRLVKILAAEGETVPVDTVLCEIDDGEESPAKTPESALAMPATTPISSIPAAPKGRRAGRVSPLAAKI